ncbi:cytochrome b [Thiomicrorhabdus immobilis]|uniref:Cytochrome b n=1 Tax=Thiomicrorhabdus immobilis TaxID=2791037 RepID=A0ABN6CXA0_9GAMM|nr:cytochrome b [Thiomicrorhabdus immobilis]BCN93760.1 cytochrome b [Thiomicrorhabdus immobilis]
MESNTTSIQMGNSSHSYGWVSIVLHWSMAISIIALFVLGLWMVGLDYYSTWYHQAPFVHKSVGVIVVLTMLVRLLWNTSQPRPQIQGSVAMGLIAHTAHLTMYLLVVLLGVSGYLISTAESQPISVFNWFEIPVLFEPFDYQADIAGDVHEILAFSLIGLVGLHLVAALKHHLYDGDDTLRRMLKPIKNETN